MKVSWDYERPDEEVVEAWGRFIYEHAIWTDWLTITFRVPQTERAAKEVLRDWTRSIAKHTGEHFKVAWVVEPHQNHGFHIHALFSMLGMARAPYEVMEELLTQRAPTSGRISWDEYDGAQTAARYISKTGLPNISVACPRTRRCRRNGCTEGTWHIS